MTLSVFDVYLITAIPMMANVSCVCEQCGYKEKREGIIVGFLFNADFKYVLSRRTCVCPGCQLQFFDTAFFKSSSEASLAIKEAMDKLGHAQRDKVLAGIPLSTLISILPAEYVVPQGVVYEPDTLNS